MNTLDHLLARVAPTNYAPLTTESFAEVPNLYARQYLQRLASILGNFEPGNPVTIGYNLISQRGIWNLWVDGYKKPIRESTLVALKAIPSTIEGWVPIRDIYILEGVLHIEISACNDTIALPEVRHEPRRRSPSPQRRRQSPHSSSRSPSPPPRRSRSRKPRDHSPGRDHSPHRRSKQDDSSVVRTGLRFLLGS